jgi:hypothetical protein
MARGGHERGPARNSDGGWGAGSLWEGLWISEAASVALMCLLAAESSRERVVGV